MSDVFQMAAEQDDPEREDTCAERLHRVIADLRAAVYILDLSEQAKYVEEEGNRQMNRILQELLIRNISRLEAALEAAQPGQAED